MKKDNKLKVTYRVNGQIRVPEVRIVGDNIESQVLSIGRARAMADEMGVDLVEISPNAEPPVCRLIEFSKFIYMQKKHAKEVKEIRFGPQTDDHDYDFKLKHAKGFLSDGDKVKAYVFFKGRSILFKEQGEVLLLRFAQDLEEYGKVESMPTLEGKRMTMFIAPKKVIAKPMKTAEELESEKIVAEAPVKKQPQQKAKKEYTGPKVEGEDFDD